MSSESPTAAFERSLRVTIRHYKRWTYVEWWYLGYSGAKAGIPHDRLLSHIFAQSGKLPRSNHLRSEFEDGYQNGSSR